MNPKRAQARAAGKTRKALAANNRRQVVAHALNHPARRLGDGV